MKLIGAIWGTIGVTYLIGKSITTLSGYAKEALDYELSTFQWVFLILYSIFMLVCEGYRGFQKKFCPRTAARVKYLYDNPSSAARDSRPLFLHGLFSRGQENQDHRDLDLTADPWCHLLDAQLLPTTLERYH